MDGIRTFDVETQRSLENLETKTIYPASDIILTEEDFARAEDRLNSLLEMVDISEQKSHLEEVLSDIKIGYHASRYWEISFPLYEKRMDPFRLPTKRVSYLLIIL